MEAGFQHRSRATSSPQYDYYYTSCRSKTSDGTGPLPFSVMRLRFPPRPDGTCRSYEPTTPTPPRGWKRHTSPSPAWVRDDVFDLGPGHKQSIEAWVDEQIHLTDVSNFEHHRRGGSGAVGMGMGMGKEELRQRMWDELVYEYEAEAHKWMKREAEMRRRAQEREREEARRRIVEEDIVRIQARVRERRDSERRAIAEERQREKVIRAERAVVDAWRRYESRWGAISASSDPIGFRDIPWPVLAAPVRVADLTHQNIAGFLLHPAHSSNHSRRDRIRTALLRWHPDRFHRILNRVIDSDRFIVDDAVGIIVRCLNELLAKEAKQLQGR